MALLLSSSVAQAIETGQNTSPITLGRSNETYSSEKTGSGLKTIQVSIEIRIPQYRLSVMKNAVVPAGFNVNEALASLYKVVNGVVCCRQTDIRCIGSVCYNPSKNHYWSIAINGDSQTSSATSLLSDQDVLVLTYSGPVPHRSLVAFLQDEYTKK